MPLQSGTRQLAPWARVVWPSRQAEEERVQERAVGGGGGGGGGGAGGEQTVSARLSKRKVVERVADSTAEMVRVRLLLAWKLLRSQVNAAMVQREVEAPTLDQERL